MNAVKEAILNKIRTGLGRGPLTEDAKNALEQRLTNTPRSTLPNRLRLSDSDLVLEFIRMTTGEATTVCRVNHATGVPAAVAAFLKDHGLPSTAVLAPHKDIEEMPWDTSGIRVRFGRAVKNDLTGVTPAFAGIAETGCLMMLSGPNHPYTLNFLPENHIAVLRRTRIIATAEDAFDLIRQQFGAGHMPRTSLMVAGPSRSADIGYSLQFGAHGPKRLHCILVE